MTNHLKKGEISVKKAKKTLELIFEDALKKLSNLGPQFKFKYCASGTITQNCGAGFHMGACCRHEKNQDNFAQATITSGSLICTLVVYGFKI